MKLFDKTNENDIINNVNHASFFVKVDPFNKAFKQVERTWLTYFHVPNYANLLFATFASCKDAKINECSCSCSFHIEVVLGIQFSKGHTLLNNIQQLELATLRKTFLNTRTSFFSVASNE